VVSSGSRDGEQRTIDKLPVRWRGGIKPRLAEAGRAMAPRTRPLAKRLAEPWEGVKYT